MHLITVCQVEELSVPGVQGKSVQAAVVLRCAGETTGMGQRWQAGRCELSSERLPSIHHTHRGYYEVGQEGTTGVMRCGVVVQPGSAW